MPNLGKVEVELDADGFVGELVIQGFRGDKPYVFIGSLMNDGLDPDREYKLTPENAHILSEEIRKHAEWSGQRACS